MNESLNPCPYCFGHSPVVTTQLIGYRITCPNCLATGPSKTTRREAKIAWNALDKQVAELRLKPTAEFFSRLKEVEQAVFAER